MNIHFKEPSLFDRLKSATIARARVGSHLYGSNDEGSDEDFLYIYATSVPELRSFVQTNHQLQYIDGDGNDHNFVSLHSFVRNCLNGDSTINFEVIQSGELLATPLEWLHNMRQYFITYTIMRSYNGLVKRDIKHFSKAQTDRDRTKRLGHIVRGLHYTNSMLDQVWGFDFDRVNEEFCAEFEGIRKFGVRPPAEMNAKLQAYRAAADEQRAVLNGRLESKTLGFAKSLDPLGGNALNMMLNMYMDSAEFRGKQDVLSGMDTTPFINAFENWVTYEK